MSNKKRKLRPVKVVPYPGEALGISRGKPPAGEFGKPPPGQIDLRTPAGCTCEPPSVLLAHAIGMRCGHCGARPGSMVLTRCGGTWYVVTEHDPSCPESVQQRGNNEDLHMVPHQPMHGQS